MSSGTLVLVTDLQMRSWERNTEKQLIVESMWAQFSNRVDINGQIPNGGTRKISDSIVMIVSSKFTEGVYKTTVPSADKLRKRGPMGYETAEGKEETPKMRFRSVHYNVQRKPITLKNGTVDGDMAKGYDTVKQGIDFGRDYFAELTDYDMQRTIIENVPEHISEEYAWEGAENQDGPPDSAKVHPYITHKGATGYIPWSNNDVTYRASIRTALLTMPTATIFDKGSLDKILNEAAAKIKPLSSWQNGRGESIKWVIKLTPIQADQLMNSDDKFGKLYGDADQRSAKNRAITGILGTYRGGLIISDQRAPICFTDTAQTQKAQFTYMKPWENEGSIPRTAYTVGNDGNHEVCQVLGKGALGFASVHDLKFISETFDYKFREGMSGSRSCGSARMDFSDGVATNRPKNWSSFLYLTPTPAVTF